MKVAVVMGSKSDLLVMQECVDLLKKFDIDVTTRIMSAHRTPIVVQTFACEAVQNGYDVIIAGAGMSAALAGCITAHTTLPVIGVPLVSGSLGGVDALLSTAQMPPGIPVAAVGIGKAGAKNAALLAVRILAIRDDDMKDKLWNYTTQQAAGVADADRSIQPLEE